MLVADDDEDTRVLLMEILEEEGYEVIGASTGREAANILENLTRATWSLDAIDLILTDVRMPEMNGEELLTLLRTAKWPVPVVMMTAYVDDALRARAHAFGTPLLEKPFSLDSMKRAVRSEMLRIRPQHSQH